MKTITLKKSLIGILAVAILIPSLQSCKKTVTPKKLNGDWDVTAGSSTSSYTNSNNETSTTSTVFDGSKETTTVTPCVGCPAQINDLKITYSFDKKAGTYTMVTVATENDVEEGVNAYTKNSSTTPATYENAGSFDRKIVAVSTTTEIGTFTVTGGTGEIEKNTQIVLSETSTVSNTDYTYTYFEENTSTSFSITDKYEYDWIGGTTPYKALVASKNELSSNTGNTYVNTTLNVESNKKGVMEVNFTSSNTYVSGATTTKSTMEGKWTLTEKK